MNRPNEYITYEDGYERSLYYIAEIEKHSPNLKQQKFKVYARLYSNRYKKEKNEFIRGRAAAYKEKVMTEFLKNG